MQKIKKGDEVEVIAGKDKGKRGKVTRMFNAESRLLVEGVNLVKKCLRGNPQRGEQGGIIDREAPIHTSNVALVNPTTQKIDKVGIRILEDGRKVRYFKSNNEQVELN